MAHWTFGSPPVTIFITKWQPTWKQTVARLHPLGGGTVYHTFGYENQIARAEGFLVGYSDLSSMEVFSQSEATIEVFHPQAGSYGDFYLAQMQADELSTVCQTLRPDLDEDAPVFKVSLELYYD